MHEAAGKAPHPGPAVAVSPSTDGGPRRRVLHVVDTFAPRVGGMETQVADLARRQAEAGHDVHVLTATAGHGPGGHRRREQTPGPVLVHRLASRLTVGVPVHPRGRHVLEEALEDLGADPPPGGVVAHVHAGVVSPFAWAGLRVAVRRRAATVVTWHCVLRGVEVPLRAAARAVGLAGDDAPFVAAAVSPVAAAHVRRALGRTRVRVVPNGVDLEAWRRGTRAARERGPVPETGTDRLVVVATQRLAPRKRADVLVASVLAAHRRLGRDAAGRPRIRLVLVGAGSRDRALRRRIGDETDVVELRGTLPREDLPALYATADVFAAPAVLEAFGLAALEARAGGLPVVTPRGSGPEGFLDAGVDSLVLPRRGVRHWTRTWVRLAEEPALRERLRRGAATPPPGGWETATEACETAYREAAELVTDDR